MLKGLNILLTYLVLGINSLYAQTVVYPGQERDAYYITLLKHVLSYSTDKNYQARAFGSDLPKGRDFILMAKDKGIDVVFGGATKEREAKYLPIRFPLLKGLNGWRIPLVHNKNKDIFLNATSMEAFKRLVPGQFHSWSDSKVLQSNGIYVEKGGSVEGLYGMLEKGRFDYFPRSVLEISWDLEAHKHLDIMMEPHVLIHYPTAYYFYVAKGNLGLANDIKAGLEASLQDGSFNNIFNRYYGESIKKVPTTKRRVYRLDNPLLPGETPLDRKELWGNLGE